MSNFYKLPSLLAFLTALCGNATAQEVFKCDFESGTLENWTVIDNNTVEGQTKKGDGSTWTAYNDYDLGNVAKYGYNSTNAADDYLITPAITLQPGIYQLSFDYKGSSYGEKMEVMIGSAPTVEGMTRTLLDLGTFLDTNQTGVAYYKAESAETVYFAFHATSEANMYNIYVDNVTVTTSQGIDAAVTGISSPQTSFDLTNAEKVTISVANTGVTDINGMTLYYKINDGEAVSETFNGTLKAGETMDYTFNTTADMERVGIYDIEAWVSAEGDGVATNNTATTTVRHRGLATVPYSIGFEADDELDLIKTFNLNNDDGNWGVNVDAGWYVFARSGSGCMMYDYDSNNPGDDWFITEGIQMEPGYYSLKFWYSTMGDHNERMLVAYGTEQRPEAMTTEIVRYDPFNTDDTYIESANVIKIDVAGIYYFGFKSFSDKDENVICIDDLSIEHISGDLNDVAITEITAPEYGYIADNTSKDVTFNISNKGINAVKGLTVNVSVDSKQIYTKQYDLTAQQTETVKISNALDGVAVGKHSLTIEIVNEGDNNPEDNTLTEEIKVMGQYVKCWNAEQGKVDDDLTLLVNDEYTSKDDMFPNNEAFSVIELGETHNLYGNWQYCASSWFVEDDATANRWLILPKVKITGENADMMWTAGSYSETYPETYNVRVSTTTPDPNWFTTVQHVTNENYIGKNLATRGISLADYAGQEIYIAFQLVTSDGDLFVLDNISLYGDIELSDPSGINNVETENGADVTVAGNEIIAEGAKAISVYDTTGRQLANSSTGRADISSLSSGIYMVKVTKADGKTCTTKIMIK